MKTLLRDLKMLGHLRDRLSFSQETISLTQLPDDLLGGVWRRFFMKILSCPLYGHYGLSQEVDQSEGGQVNSFDQESHGS